eukprot:PhF_6_TR43529/c0_g1_i1/m.66820
MSGGAVLLTLSEYQDNLLKACLTEVVEIGENGNTTGGLEKKHLQGRVVHISGTVTANPPYSHDPATGVEFPHALQTKRIVKMYQWSEKRREDTDKDTKRTVIWYEHSKVWSDKPVTTEVVWNPPFPRYQPLSSSPKECVITAANGVALRIGTDMIEQLGNYIPVHPSSTPVAFTRTDDGSAARANNLHLPNEGKEFYTWQRNPDSPVVGDVRVSYTALPPGPYTFMGIVDDKDTLHCVHTESHGVCLPFVKFSYASSKSESLATSKQEVQALNENRTASMAMLGGLTVVAGGVVMTNPLMYVVGTTAATCIGLGVGLGVTVALRRVPEVNLFERPKQQQER